MMRLEVEQDFFSGDSQGDAIEIDSMPIRPQLAFDIGESAVENFEAIENAEEV